MRLFESEKSLIENCQKGERNAQRQLFDKYSRRFLGVCQRYISNNFEAEDVLMGSFMKIFQSIKTYKNEGSFEGWMRRIVVNEALQHLRKNRNLHVSLDADNTKPEPDYVALEMNLEEADLLQMIGSMPEGYRAVFNLFAIEGYSHKEISEMLSISEGTSKSQLSRARGHLQACLQQIEIAQQRVRV